MSNSIWFCRYSDLELRIASSGGNTAQQRASDLHRQSEKGCLWPRTREGSLQFPKQESIGRPGNPFADSPIPLWGAAMARNEIRLMEAAIALAEELNFSRAGYRLGVTQPAVTKQVAELEDRLGFPLFERDHQLVTLTDAGRAFVEEARLAVLHSERAIRACG